ncbi:hypothetical protein F5144DRAFT_201942 [Chaetomium tenue]|uniref:Uncharacterized protein n=1 Tax=Chaetomium tenue TaxID=1854479 RepID=A0ACB7PHX7_9PEZI|nr:hypothetical protein F5144DRAFT_201942 [Chaetomium globosum]
MVGKRKTSDAKTWSELSKKSWGNSVRVANQRRHLKRSERAIAPRYQDALHDIAFDRRKDSDGSSNLSVDQADGALTSFWQHPPVRRANEDLGPHPQHRSLLDRATPPAADMAESSMSVSKRASRWKVLAATLILAGRIIGGFAASSASRPTN